MFDSRAGKVLAIYYGVINISALSSAGRASALQAEGQRFEPVSADHAQVLLPDKS